MTNYLIYYLYGGGMPFMYILGIILGSYINYKFLFFYWHQKSFGFNEDVAFCRCEGDANSER